MIDLKDLRKAKKESSSILDILLILHFEGIQVNRGKITPVQSIRQGYTAYLEILGYQLNEFMYNGRMR